MAATGPSLGVLREMSDEAVLRALMEERRLTRAELAVVTGLSKPTTGEAIRRLERVGLVSDTGERTSRRGGVGTYYQVAGDVGAGLAVSLAPDGVVIEVLDALGTVLERVAEPVHRPAAPEAIAAALDRCARAALGGRCGLVATVAAAKPVARASGELVHLPGAPFLLGPLSPAEVLSCLVEGPVLVDNDVNWAARAERAVRGDAGPQDFVYLYLGEGIGCAVVADGEVRRGHRGLAGEVLHLLVPSPDGRALPLSSVLDRLGLYHPGSTAIDIERLLATLGSGEGPVLARDLAVAIAGIVEAAIAFADPALVVLGGPWAGAACLTAELHAAVGDLSTGARLEAPLAGHDAALAGARLVAVQRLRDEIVSLSRSDPRPGPGRGESSGVPARDPVGS